MSLTIDRRELGSDALVEQQTAPERPDEAAAGVERWLEVMYGIRPDAAVRATFVPMTDRCSARIADWLSRLWGLSCAAAPSAVTVDVSPGGYPDEVEGE
jgi:hypothetical protein